MSVCELDVGVFRKGTIGLSVPEFALPLLSGVIIMASAIVVGWALGTADISVSDRSGLLQAPVVNLTR